jgi:hypothetical protein
MPLESPVRDLINHIHKLGKSWLDLQEALNDRTLQSTAYGTKKPPLPLVSEVLRFCVEESITVPDELRASLHEYCVLRSIHIPADLDLGFEEDEDNAAPEVLTILDEVIVEEKTNPPHDAINSEEPAAAPNPAEYTIISALGLNQTATQKSLKRHGGAYFHFSVLNDKSVVTSVCHLSGRLGADRAPIYRSWRQVPPQDGVRRYRGAYFSTDNHLYLLASREGAIDVRLSIFHVVGEAPKPQNILRGVWLGVPNGEQVLSSRCVLVRRGVLTDELQAQVCRRPRSRSFFDGQKELKEVAAYLFNQSPHCIQFSTSGG